MPEPAVRNSGGTIKVNASGKRTGPPLLNGCDDEGDVAISLLQTGIDGPISDASKPALAICAY